MTQKLMFFASFLLLISVANALILNPQPDDDVTDDFFAPDAPEVVVVKESHRPPNHSLSLVDKRLQKMIEELEEVTYDRDLGLEFEFYLTTDSTNSSLEFEIDSIDTSDYPWFLLSKLVRQFLRMMVFTAVTMLVRYWWVDRAEEEEVDEQVADVVRLVQDEEHRERLLELLNELGYMNPDIDGDTD